ncbi:MAG TPA: LemA family protein [bacterium]|nr:LemA family protein [bacterium]
MAMGALGIGVVIFGVLAVGLVVLALILAGMYNGLVGKKNQVENVFGSVDVQLKKRYDLIPNLVASVQQYMQHEKGLLTEVTALRAKAMDDNLSTDEKVALNNQMSKALGGIMVAIENYPQLKANENVLQLQAALNETEEQIAAARRAYNAAVTDYNNAVEMFPTNLLSGVIGYRRKEVFAASEQDRQNPNVKDLFRS